MSNRFRAVVLEEVEGKVTAAVSAVAEEALPDDDVTVDASHSILNYKDGLFLNGLGRLVRDYPHVPGIDFPGTVVWSLSERYRKCARTILTDWRGDESRWGGC